jgi:hypothetical protein
LNHDVKYFVDEGNTIRLQNFHSVIWRSHREIKFRARHVYSNSILFFILIFGSISSSRWVVGSLLVKQKEHIKMTNSNISEYKSGTRSKKWNPYRVIKSVIATNHVHV